MSKIKIWVKITYF